MMKQLISIKTALLSGIVLSTLGTTYCVGTTLKDSDLLPSNKWCICNYTIKTADRSDLTNHPADYSIKGPKQYITLNTIKGSPSCKDAGQQAVSTLEASIKPAWLTLSNPTKVTDLQCVDFAVPGQTTYGDLKKTMSNLPRGSF